MFVPMGRWNIDLATIIYNWVGNFVVITILLQVIAVVSGSLSPVLHPDHLHHHLHQHHHHSQSPNHPHGFEYPVRWTKPPHQRRRRPVHTMTDVINDLGVKILDRYIENDGNVAFSPSGLGFVLVALYEGSAGSSASEISKVLGLPQDRRITRIGLRDVHRRLRSYLNADAFLGGLTLNRDDINLRPEYEDVLRFYGFDISDDGNLAANLTTNINGFPNITDATPPQTAAINPTTINNAVEVITNVSSTRSPQTGGTNVPTTIDTMSVTNTVETNPTTTDAMNGRIVSSPGTPSPASTTQISSIATQNQSSTVANGVSTGDSISNTSSMTTTATNNTMDSISGGNSGDLLTINSSGSVSNTTGSTNPDATMNPLTVPLTDFITNSINSMGSTTPLVTTMPPINETTISSSMPIQMTTTVGDTITNAVRKRRSVLQGPPRYLPQSADDGIWLDVFGRLSNHDDYQSQDDEIVENSSPSTQLDFLINGCDYSRVTAATYTAVLPFAHFPSLQTALLEFPLDDPRYKIIVMLPSESNGTKRLAKILATKPITLRQLRRALQPTWVNAVIPSFMLRGFVTLTPYLQKLGISDVFEPRTADLSPMSPDLGVYARDIQQSIGVNIRNNIDGGIGGAGSGNEDQKQQQESGNLVRGTRGVFGLPPFFVAAGGPISSRSIGNVPYSPYPGGAGPIPFVVDRPFLYFIVDDETSVSLLAGRIDDPLNSRIMQ